MDRQVETWVDPETGEILDHSIVDSQPSPPTPNMAMIAIEPGLDTSVKALGEEALKLSLYAGRMVIADAPSAKAAINDIAVCRDYISKVEAEQKKWLAPLKEAEKRIKAGFELILGPLKAANDTMTGKLSAYTFQLQARADEAAAIVQKTQELEALKAQAEGREYQPEPLPPAVPVAKTTRSGFADATTIGTWKWRWNPKLSLTERLERLPMAYHMANEAMIGATVRGKGKTGITEADFGGAIEIYLEESVRIAPKRGA